MIDPETKREVTAKSQSKLTGLLKLFLKITITLTCLWYVSTKLDLKELVKIVSKASLNDLLAALFVFFVSKIFASKRLILYFKAIPISISEWENIKLFWLGMFYNLFLPGSITGDVYKVFLLKKTFNTSYKRLTAAVLLDRFSGLLGLGVLLAVYGLYVLESNLFILVLVIVAVLAIVLSYFIIRKFFHVFSKIFWSTFLWGIFVQILMVLCIELILRSLGYETNPAYYVFIFLIAAVAGVLPLTIGGGLGIREFIFLEGAKYFGLDQHLAVAVSLLFYFVTLIASLPGIIFVFNNPLPKNS